MASDGTRGRPRKQGIDRFNIATDLIGSRKFVKFRRALGLEVPMAKLALIQFWEFVAINYAFAGTAPDDDKGIAEVGPQLDPDDFEVIAEHCFFEGDPKALIMALKGAGFLDNDLRIHEWYTHQPLAAKIQKSRDESKDAKKDGRISVPENRDKSPSGRISVPESRDKSTLPPFSGAEMTPKITSEYKLKDNLQGNSGSSQESELVNSVSGSAQTRVRAHENAGEKFSSSERRQEQPTVKELASEVSVQLSALFGQLPESEEAMLFRMTENAVRELGTDQPVWRLLGEVREGIRERRLTNPFGLVIAELKKLGPHRQNGKIPHQAPG